jgi:hypothetical protein
MADRDDLLTQGPHTAPEPETAEERTKRVGKGGLAGGAVAGGAAAVKFAGAGKALLWLFAWNGAVDMWRLGGWIALVLTVAAITLVLVLRSRREG